MIDVDLILRFPDLELPADQQPGHRVPVSMDGDVAFDIDQTVMERVDLRDEQRQGLEMGPFRGEELPRAPMQMVLIRGVHLVAPRTRLGIEIGEIRKPPPGEEIAFNETHRHMRRVAYADISEANRYAK